MEAIIVLVAVDQVVPVVQVAKLVVLAVPLVQVAVVVAEVVVVVAINHSYRSYEIYAFSESCVNNSDNNNSLSLSL